MSSPLKVVADKALSQGTKCDDLQSSIESKKKNLELQSHRRELDKDLDGLQFKDVQHVAKVLPPHACKYCGIHEPATVAMCNICKKSFCNGRGNTSASHIVSHLLGSKHREITLHADGLLGEKILECDICGKRNIFELGYMPAKADARMKLLCRQPCAARRLEWRPVVEERSISPCLVKQPSEQDQLRVRPITIEQIKELEELWLKNDEATIEDMAEMKIDSKPSPVLQPLRHELDQYVASMTKDDKNNNLELQSHRRELDKDLDGLQFKDVQHVAKVLPPHACKYCGIHEPATVAMCNICKKSFCNGRGNTSASHIVSHLLGSKHREITLHADGLLGEKILKCDICGKRNTFELGYIPAKADAGMKLLCRQPCAARRSEWRPVVAERSISPCLVKQPSEQDQLRVRPITIAQIKKLEELWLKNDEATIDDVVEMKIDSKPSPVLLQYEDAAQYERIFCLLLRLEGEYQRQLTEQATQNNIQVRWHVSLQKTIVAHFSLTQTDSKLKLMHGDELRLRYLDASSKSCTAYGHVIKLCGIHADNVELKMKICTNACITSTTTVSVEFIWKRSGINRMQYAFKKFNKRCNTISPYLHKKLLGKAADDKGATSFPGPWPNQWHAPYLPALNGFQINAVQEALKNELTLIQGPPGTGKTVTAATIVYHLVKKHGGRVLVCAPSNTAVDLLAEKIHLTNLKVVRVCAKGRENIDCPVSFLALHNQVSQMDPELKKLHQLKAKIGELSSVDEKLYLVLQEAHEKKVLLAADVICCTCIGAGDRRLSDIECRSVLIDEAGQATEPECLVPVMLGAKQLILVGDQCQLGPVVMCKEAADAGLTQSLFERLILLGMRPIRLSLQYRMHPELSLFPSNHFYEGMLQNAVTAKDRRLKEEFPWPQTDRPMFFLASLGQEEIAGSGTSYLNRMEAIIVEQIATYFLKASVKPQRIGVITPYQGQRAFLVRHMVHMGRLYEEIEVANVDAFQGREKDLIIMSCVRSNEQEGIGFLKDPRRLNVAITRAKYGLIIVGNPHVLAKHQLWADLLSFFKQRKLLVEGPLNNLQESHVYIQKPKKNIGAYFDSNLVDNIKKQQVPAVRGGSATQLPHDSIGYKSNVHTSASLRNKPIPRGVFGNLTNMAPQCYNQNQLAIEAAKQRRPAPRAIGSWTTTNDGKKQ